MPNGLLDYVQTQQITSDFLQDFNNLCKKIYKRWCLSCSLEDFIGYCTEKLVLRISGFEPSKGNIQNYVYNLILNEARRVYSAGKHLSNTDLDVVSLYTESSTDTDSLLRKLWDFAIYAYQHGIWVNQKQLLANYQCKNMTPAVKAFVWFIQSGRV